MMIPVVPRPWLMAEAKRNARIRKRARLRRWKLLKKNNHERSTICQMTFRSYLQLER